MINPKKELFVWGPIEGVLHYPWYFCVAIVKMFPKAYKGYWPEIAFIFINHKMTFICEYDALRKSGWEVAKQWVLPKQKYAFVRFRFDRAVGKLNALNRRIAGLRLLDLPNTTLAEEYCQWKKVYLDFWLHGLIPEITNWGQEKFLMDALKKRGLDSQEYLHALEVLSAPSGIGFFQEAERDLLRIAITHNPLQLPLILRGRDRSVPPLKVIGGEGELWTALQKHAQKYFWLHNSYFSTKVLTVRDFERRLKEEVKKGDLAKRIYDIEQGPTRRAKAKEQLIRKLKLTPLEACVARVLGATVSWQDERKKYIWQSNQVIDLWLKEAARRTGAPFVMCKDLLPEELERIFAGKKLNVRKLAQARRVSAGYLKGDRLSLVVGAKAQVLATHFQRKEAGTLQEVSGLVVSKGPMIRGRVRLIFSPHKEQKRMKQGDILVTSMTSPDYIVVMKRARAIVTDEGGMTSHAAVVSRELGIPCIVGTKVATQVFKDEDLVEVDTGHGVVRKLK